MATLERMQTLPLRVLALRCLPGGAAGGEPVLRRTLAGFDIGDLPPPGRWLGERLHIAWRSPSEYTALCRADPVADALLAALPVRTGATAFALDLSAGHLVIELQRGTPQALDALLLRTVDADALPQRPRQATRLRFADIAVGLWRLADDRAWLIADRSHEPYLRAWLAYAAERSG